MTRPQKQATDKVEDTFLQKMMSTAVTARANARQAWLAEIAAHARDLKVTLDGETVRIKEQILGEIKAQTKPTDEIANGSITATVCRFLVDINSPEADPYRRVIDKWHAESDLYRINVSYQPDGQSGTAILLYWHFKIPDA